MLVRQRDTRPYATAAGFYLGDRVEINPEGYMGSIEKVFGSDSHVVIVKMDSGQSVQLEDFDLTRR